MRIRWAISVALAEQSRRTAHVEKRLVERERLDQRRVPSEDLVHLPADLAVQIVVTGQEHSVRAAPPSHGRRQRGMNPVPAGLVGGGCDDPPQPGPPDDHRLADQIWSPTQLDRHEECIHVDMQDAALSNPGHQPTLVPCR